MKYSEYQGYTGSFEYSVDDKFLFGKVIGLKELISYEGKAGMVSDYLKPSIGAESIRWALSSALIANFLGAFFFFMAARTIREDLIKV